MSPLTQGLNYRSACDQVAIKVASNRAEILMLWAATRFGGGGPKFITGLINLSNHRTCGKVL